MVAGERDLEALTVVAAIQPVTIAQVSRITGRAYSDARDTLERLCAGCYAEVRNQKLGLSPNDPNVYRLTYRGATLLGVTVRPWQGTSDTHVRHEILVRDTAAWIAAAARHHQLEMPKIKVRGTRLGPITPDAIFDQPIARDAATGAVRRLVGLVEADRGTERGSERWTEKALGYRELFAADALEKAVGSARARILVFAPNAARIQTLIALITKVAPETLRHFWFTGHATLKTADLTRSVWTHQATTKPLIHP